VLAYVRVSVCVWRRGVVWKQICGRLLRCWVGGWDSGLVDRRFVHGYVGGWVEIMSVVIRIGKKKSNFFFHLT